MLGVCTQEDARQTVCDGAKGTCVRSRAQIQFAQYRLNKVIIFKLFMSLATNIKEFAEILHNIYAQQLSSINGTDIVSDGVMPLAIPKIVILQQACVYFIKTLGHQIFGLLTFQWLRDFSYFPLLSNETGSSENVLADTFLSSPGSHLFSFSKNGVALMSPASKGPSLLFNGFLKSDWLLTGFINSFFFSLPFSLPHFITLRRMFSQGAAAAAASILGTVAAHSLVLLGVIYGIRFLVIPYYSLQPLTFLIGIVIMAIVITEFVKDKRMYLVPLNHYPSLIRIGIINFIVALCESATVFHDLHHLTLNPEVSYLQLYQSNSALSSFFSQTAYLLIFILGHITFSFLFCYSILKGNEKLCSLTGWTLPKTASRINKGLLIAILALTFSTFPYYGLDYLFTKSAGFLPEDPAYSNTIFSPTQVRSRNRHFKSRAPAIKNEKTPLELDLNYFDRGMYLNAPKEEKISPKLQNTDLYNSLPTGSRASLTQEGLITSEGSSFITDEHELDAKNKLGLGFEAQKNPLGLRSSKKENLSNEHEGLAKSPSFQNEALPVSGEESMTAYDPALTFEELNYQGESAWLMRHERARRLPEEQDSKKSSIFQKPKSHFKELRLEQDNKQARAALLEGTQLGSISELKEGNRFEEKFRGFKRLKSSEELPLDTFGKDLDFGEGEGKKEVKKEMHNVTEGEHTFGVKGDRSSSMMHQRALLKQLFFDKEIASNYEKSFASPFGDESDGTPPDLLPVENIIKKRYRLNPVYRALLQSDIDFFIARQPNDYKITQNQEVSLFKKRQLLEKYYNSIRYYSPIESVLHTEKKEVKPYISDASVGAPSGQLLAPTGHGKKMIDHQKGDATNKEKLSVGSVFMIEGQRADSLNNDVTTKSFVEMVYHQQFKGTLNTVKRFFKLTFDEQQNPNRNRILSYDQLLYKNLGSVENKKKYHPSLHEELSLEKISPFIEESNSAPIYAGWDEKARRFVITNRFNFIE